VEDWIEVKQCHFCGNEVLLPYKTVNTAPYLQINFCHGSFPVMTPSVFIKCTDCGLVMQSPRMSSERIDYYYSSGVYRDTLGIPVEAMDADEKRRASETAQWLNIKPASHVDIGASRGYLLHEIGADVAHGIDTNENYGAEITSRNTQYRYELVTSVHCLEHTTNPLKELHWYKSLSTDKIYIEVPGENCKGGPLRFAHLFYFPPAVLVDMVESIGLKIIRTETEPNTRILCTI
jgi:hypothetical protein